MLNAKKLFAMIMVLMLMSSLVIAVFAIPPIDMEDNVTLSNVNPHEYSTIPEEIYPFIYRGTAPYLSVDIDTSACVLNRLYVYNETDNSVAEISELSVTEYTATMDALFYVTESNEIYKSDYTGQCAEFIYRGESGAVENMECYYDMFVFTQDDDIILMDLSTQATQILWTCSDIDYFFILSDTELLIVTTFEEFYIYNILIGEPRAVDAEEFNYRLDQLQSNAENVQNSDASVMIVYPGGLEYYKNDVSFPLPEYPVNYKAEAKYKNYHYPDPARWFHTNTQLEGCSQSNCARYAGAGECMGFARYAHDVYNHMLDYTITDSNPDQWYVGKNMHHAVQDEDGNWIFPHYFENTEKNVRDFFAGLETGNYVRYGHYDDGDIEDGIHSMVLVGKDSLGIWVYECNQNYYKDLDPDRIDGRSKSFFGCGVHLQYHTYEVLAGRYDFVVKYTDHAYDEAPVYDSATYHKVGCTCCVGYLRQTHEGTATIVSATQHNATYTCCPNNSGRKEHTGTVICRNYTKLQHKIYATCCDGFVLGLHTFDQNSSGSYICTECGADRDSSSGVLKLEPIEILYDA